ncbi:hypothetical protein HDU76_000590 [Blyttiomyces sp. JEL0837]|nr:hypothetical protein HDU76_000590 [Blyttiomyces sp. JEL0837]
MTYPVAIDTQYSVKKNVFAPSGARGIPHAVILLDRVVIWAGHPMDPKFEEELAEAVKKSTPKGPIKQPEPLPLITESYEELLKKSVKELKQILGDRKIDMKGLAEKGDLAKKIVETCSTVTYYA